MNAMRELGRVVFSAVCGFGFGGILFDIIEGLGYEPGDTLPLFVIFVAALGYPGFIAIGAHVGWRLYGDGEPGAEA